MLRPKFRQYFSNLTHVISTNLRRDEGPGTSLSEFMDLSAKLKSGCQVIEVRRDSPPLELGGFYLQSLDPILEAT